MYFRKKINENSITLVLIKTVFASYTSLIRVLGQQNLLINRGRLADKLEYSNFRNYTSYPTVGTSSDKC